MPRFSHLHVHTQFSLLDGAASIKSLYEKAAQDQMEAIAITDHGNMYGVFEFVQEAWKKTKVVGKNEDGSDKKEPVIKPIAGCEFYVVADRHKKNFTKEQKDVRYHQVLLAKNKQGYQNLIKLTSLGFIEGLYSKYPRIDKELILQYHEGLIATTCCIGAYVPQTILHEGEEAAEKEFKWWLDIFGDDYFIELQRHRLKEQDIINETLMRFAKKYKVPMIATNDSHYTNEEDANAHDILLCLNTGEKQATPGFDDFVNDELQVKNRRFKFPNNQFYFKSQAEMNTLFADIPEAIDNTGLIVSKIEPLNLIRDIALPEFPLPKAYADQKDKNLAQWEYLKHLTYKGAQTRYHELTDEIIDRIESELSTIKIMQFSGYFLIVADFIAAGRNMGVFIGPGRGSAAGSVVAFCIGITNIDPIKYQLLFERFLNPERMSMPDIDTDFDDAGRQKVIDYVVGKYGKNQVAQIITYGTMAAKMSIKDVARVLDLPLPESNALAKLVPEKPGTNLGRVLKAPIYTKEEKDGEEALQSKEAFTPDEIENIKKLRQVYAGDDLRAEVLREAERLEGSIRNTGLHAAGIIIAPRDLTEMIPVATAKDSALWITQIEGNTIEQAGVLKMDFLGLKTLSILKTTLELIKQNFNGVEIDLDSLPLDDEKTFEIFQRGETNGIFQFESRGMVKYLRELKPDKFSHLIAMNALYRPGPLAYIPKFILRKNCQEEITYDLPVMKDILEDTYGITVYQEQVMLLSQALGNFTKGQADNLRKAMGKKDRKKLDSMKDAFLEGGLKNAHPKDILEKIWTDWEAFAEYAFNKSHSTCYAVVAYQTAWLKAHYPHEYMAAVLNHAGSIDKITGFMEECKRMGLNVLGPDINESIKGFSPNKKGEIRFGFGGLKGVGDAAIDAIVLERNTNGAFADIFDFIKRVNQRSVNKKSLESLVYAGAFDCFTDLHRAQYFYTPPHDNKSGLEKIIQFGNQYHNSIAQKSNTLFGDAAFMDIPAPKIAQCPPWSLTELLDFEKEVTGMFISGHPLDHFKFEMAHYDFTLLTDFNDIANSPTLIANMGKNTFRLAGLITDAQHRVTKTGRNFGSVIIEDFSGKREFMLWGDTYVRFKNYLEKGKCILIAGNFQKYYNRDQVDFKIGKIQLLETVKPTLTKKLEIMIAAHALTEEMIRFFMDNISANPGQSVLSFKVLEAHEHIEVNLYTLGHGFTMNEALADFLANSPDMDLKIELSGN